MTSPQATRTQRLAPMMGVCWAAIDDNRRGQSTGWLTLAHSKPSIAAGQALKLINSPSQSRYSTKAYQNLLAEAAELVNTTDLQGGAISQNDPHYITTMMKWRNRAYTCMRKK